MDIVKSKDLDIRLESDSILSNGYGMVSRSIMMDNKLSIQAKGLLSLLTSMSGTKGNCYPKIDSICGYLNISKNSFLKYSAELQRLGYIKVKRFQKENNMLGVNIYYIAMNYSTIEQNKLDYANKKGLPSPQQLSSPKDNDSIHNVFNDSIPQNDDKDKEIIRTLLSNGFTDNDINKMTKTELERAYSLLANRSR